MPLSYENHWFYCTKFGVDRHAKFEAQVTAQFTKNLTNLAESKSKPNFKGAWNIRVEVGLYNIADWNTL